jgi:hypothetical protein
MVSPAGRPLALTLSAELPPAVMICRLKGWPVRPVALELLMIAGPAGGGCTPIVRVAVVVPPALEAARPTENVPVAVGVPTIALSAALKLNPGGRLETLRSVAPLATN